MKIALATDEIITKEKKGRETEKRSAAAGCRPLPCADEIFSS